MTASTSNAPSRPNKPSPWPATHPRLPIIAFRSDDMTAFDGYYSSFKAMQAAYDRPRDELFDVRGAALRLVHEDDGSSRLVAATTVDPAKLRERLLTALRARFEQAGDGARMAGELKAFLDWLAAAPGVDDLIHALGLAQIDDLEVPVGKGCDRCSKNDRMKRGVPPCCPG